MDAMNKMLAGCVFHYRDLSIVPEQGLEWEEYRLVEWPIAKGII